MSDCKNMSQSVAAVFWILIIIVPWYKEIQGPWCLFSTREIPGSWRKGFTLHIWTCRTFPAPIGWNGALQALHIWAQKISLLLLVRVHLSTCQKHQCSSPIGQGVRSKKSEHEGKSADVIWSHTECSQIEEDGCGVRTLWIGVLHMDLQWMAVPGYSHRRY